MIIKQIQNLINNTIKTLFPNCSINQYLVEKCKNIKNGDYATNVAMVLAKHLKKNQVEIANDLINVFKENYYFKKV